jgi:hypothetical protein
MIQQKAKGFKDLGEGFGINWMLFNRLNKDQVDYMLNANHMFPCYGDPGQRFADEPIIRHTRARTLITQFIGL